MSATSRVITVAPGAAIGGNVTFELKSSYGTGRIFLVFTPNWGDRTTAGSSTQFSSPLAASTQQVNLGIQGSAPLTPGTYWIIAAANNEGSAQNLLSCTSSIAGNPVWNDGNDIADWSLSTIQAANTAGTVQVPYLYSSGAGWANIPATAIQVTVTDPPHYTVSTVAGGGTVPLGVTSLSLELGEPTAVLVDAAGNRYIALANQNRVIRVNLSGKVDLVIGDGLAGFAGDGGPASAARLNVPNGLAMDGSGNLYIADSGNEVIRKVTMASGIITTVVGTGSYNFSGDGGVALAATLRSPSGVAFDSSGNLFILDAGSQRIRRVDASTGIITTVAGSGAAGFAGDGGQATSASINSALGIAVGAPGNLFIADTGNNRIRRVTLSTGVITTVAGTGAVSFNGDGGQAAAATLNYPTAVAVDSSGNLFIADNSHGRIRRVDASTGVITTVAGGGTAPGDGGSATGAQLNGPRGLTFDGSGNLFIAEASTNRVRKVAAGTQVITTADGGGSPSEGSPATNAILEVPGGLAVDSQGNVYISATDNHRVRRVDRATGTITTIAGNGAPGFGGDNGPATKANLNFPQQIALDPAGNLFIADSSNNRIRKIAAGTGIMTTVAGGGSGGDGGLATSASLSNPTGVAVDAAGNLYIADNYNNRVRKVTAATGIITAFAGTGTQGFGGDGGPARSANLSGPVAVALDGAGNLFIADRTNQRIRRVDAATGNITTFSGNGTAGNSGDGGAATAAGLNYPSGVAVDALGNAVIADKFNLLIHRVDAQTGLITVIAGGRAPLVAAGDGAAPASLSAPYTLTLDSAGGIYFSEASNLVRLLTPVVAQRSLLTISKTGTGNGTVTAGGSGFSCGAICSTLIASGATVSLTAAADPNSAFTGWSGACFGASACSITMGAAVTVTAGFAQQSSAAAVLLTPPPGSVLQGPTVTFTWSPGTLVSSYSLKVGNSPGSAEFYGVGPSLTAFASVIGLPTDGRTLSVRLASLIGGLWQTTDYSYTATRTDQLALYDDAIENSWLDCSSAQVDWNSSSPVHSGNHSIRVALASATALCFSKYLQGYAMDFTLFGSLTLWLHGGVDGGQQLAVQASINYGTQQPAVILPPLVADTWQQVSIPIASLHLNTQANTVQIFVKGVNDSAQSSFYVDDVALSLSPPPSQIRVTADTTQVLRTVDPRQFGTNVDVFDSHFDQKAALLKEFDVHSLRFHADGDDYHWESNHFLGDYWTQPFYPNLSSDDFAVLANNIGAQAFIIANYGTGTPDEAASWVRHSNVLNHYSMKYWEIGNEEYFVINGEPDNNVRPHDPYTYAVRFKDYYTQMKAVDSTIRIGAVAIDGEDSYPNYTDHPATNPRTGVTHNGWTPVLLSTLKALGVTPDFLIFHKYNLFPGHYNDFDTLQSTATWAPKAANLRQQLNDYLGVGADRVELLATEHNSVGGMSRQQTSLVNGLFLADSVAQSTKTEFNAILWFELGNGWNADYTPGLYGWRMYSDWGVAYNLDWTDKYPTFYAAKIFQFFARGGDQVLSASTDYGLLSAHAAKRADGTLSLMVVNKSPVWTLQSAVSLNGFTPAPNAVVYSYGIPQDEAARTGVGSPDIAQTTFSGAASSFNYSFPPYSITVISLSPAPAPAQPTANIAAVANGASFQAGFASATWVSIFGTNFSETTRTWQDSDFVNGLLPTALDGLSVTINGRAAYVEFISPTQVNVLAPDDATMGAVQVQVTTAQGKSNSFTAQKQQFAPGFFAIGGNYVAALHADYTYVAKPGLLAGVTTQPAKPGETILIYGTGFGPTNPPLPSAQLVTTPPGLANSVQVTIGGVVAPVAYVGLVEAGLYQLNVTVPNIPSGDAAVVAQVGGVQSQTGVLITIQQ